MSGKRTESKGWRVTDRPAGRARSIDDKVPVSQADDVAAALKAKSGCDVEYMRLQGKDHLYDVDPKEEMREIYDWIKKHVKGA